MSLVDKGSKMSIMQFQMFIFLQPHCYGLKCVPPQNPNVEALTRNVNVFGDGVFKEIIKVK